MTTETLLIRDEFTLSHVHFMLYYPVNLMHYSRTILCPH